MELPICCVIHFLFFVRFQVVFADHRNLQFQKKSPTGNLFGLGCAIENWDKFQSRGARFNPLTRECESLTESWFTNQIEEAGFTYFQLRMTEDVFQPTDHVLFKLPTAAMTEFSVVLFFNSGYDLLVQHPDTGNQLEIDFQTTDESEIGFHSGFRTILQEVVFISFISGSWLNGQIHSPSIVSKQNTIYKFEAKFNLTLIQAYIDDVHVVDFTHQTTFSNYQVVRADTVNGAEILQLQFYYPVDMNAVL